jgi:ABC-2 type transport system ATP-binding protein
MTSLIEVRNLTRYYANRCVVDDLSFTLEKGDVLGFLGPNGAGKSTTMRMLAGNLAPSAGHISVDGIDLLEQPRRAKSALGYLPEIPPLYTELTVDEYLRYCGRLHGLRGKALEQALGMTCERCALGGVRRRLLGNLSKGFAQRVGLAQAVLHRPHAVILDEPTAGLDPIQVREIRTLVQEIATEHGVILSTHILPEVQSTCNRILIIHEGRLVFSEHMDTLRERARPTSLLAAFRELPEQEQLRTLPGVRTIEPLGEHTVRIHCDDARNTARAAAEAAVAGGWGLQELTPERTTLEQMFVELTTADPATRVETPA